MTIKYLKGSKGGGGGSAPSPTRTPDNLRSKDTMEVILAISEGPCYGLRNGDKDFFVGGTALQNSNDSYNFKTFVLNFFPGTDTPDPVIPILGGTTANKAVNVTLASGLGVTRTTSIRNIDYIDIRLAFSQLFLSNDSGTFNAQATYRLEYKKTADVTWTKVYGQDITISGKTTSTYVKETRISVPNISDDDFDLRVTKVSADSDSTYFCTMGWESFQEIIGNARTYPNTAIIQLSGEASDQFTSIPSWSGIYRGLLVKLPSNYNPETRVYTGAWDGTWQVAWTNNPAWCLYDFVMNDRYGIKSYYTEINLDKYDVYEAAQWCDGMVPDGSGGLQPRYTFNSLITEARSGKELARYIAGVFNATFFDDLNSKAYLRVDKDDPAAHIFVKENTYDDNGFEYSYTDITTRYNDITVTFINPELNWVEDRRRVYDQALIDKNGRIPLDFIAVGCNNAHEAVRRAYYKLIVANTETCLVTLRTNRLGDLVNPFDVMLICDPDMGYGISGRLKAIADDRFSATIGRPVYLEIGVDYTLAFTLDDGSKYRIGFTTPIPGYNSEFFFNDELPDNMPDKAVFTLESTVDIGTPRPFRVMQVEEISGSSDSFLIQGISINRNKWYDADNLVNSGTVQYAVLPNPFDPPGPISCGFSERYVKDQNRFELIVSPEFDRGAYKYYSNDHSFEVWSRMKDSGEAYTKREVFLGDTLFNHPPGLYEFKILGKSYLGPVTRLDAAPVFTFNVTNPKDAPHDVDWVKINKREVYWGYTNPPSDFAGFILRYHNQALRTTWDDAAQPHQGILTVTSYYTQLIPPSARVIMIRAVDAFGIVSENSAIIYRAAGDVSAVNVLDQFDYHPTWSGTKTACSVISGQLKADDTGTLMYSGVPTAFMYDGGNLYEASYFEMLYEDEFVVSSPGQLILNIDFDGSGYEFLYKLSTETDYKPVAELQALEVGTYNFSLRVFGGPVRGVIRTFSVIIDADDIVEDIQDLSVDAAGTRVPLTKEYTTIKIVSVTIQDDGVSTATGAKVFDKDPVLGPLIKLTDPLGLYVDGLVDVTIKGYK